MLQLPRSAIYLSMADLDSWNIL